MAYLVRYFFLFSVILSGCTNSGTVVDEFFNSTFDRVKITLDAPLINLNEGSTHSILITLDKKIANATDLQWSINSNSSEFESVSGTLSMAEGASSVLLSLKSLQNSISDGQRTYTLEISGPYTVFTNNVSISLSIIDDESPPLINISDVTINEGSSSSSATFTVSLIGVSSSDINLNYSTVNGTASAGSDYIAQSGNITIPAGTTTKTISVPILGDGIYELNEVFNVVLSGGTGYTTSGSDLVAASTITDDDLLNNNWNFSASTDYNFNSNYINFSAGAITLKPINMNFNSSSTWNQGSHYGTSVSSDGKLNLVSKANTATAHVTSILSSKSSDLVAYIRFDGDYVDSGPLSFSTTVAGSVSRTSASLVGSESGNFSNSFSGDYIDVPVSQTWTKMTISAWGFESSSNGSFDTIVASNLFRFQRTGGASGTINADFASGGGSGSGGSNIASLGKWNHYLITWNGSSIKLYLNGMLRSTVARSAAMDITGLRIGDDGISGIGGSDGWEGYLDEIAVWKTDLSEDEIMSLYKNQSVQYSAISFSWAPKWNQVVGYWPFDASWVDKSGNALAASPQNGSTFTNNSKVSTHASEFDGTDDGAYLAYSSSMDVTNAASVAAWIYYDSTDNSNSGIFEQSVGDSVNTKLLLFIESERLVWRLNPQSGSFTHINSNSILPRNVWIHVVGTWDGNTARMYINGVQQNSTMSVTAPLDSGNGGSYIGRLFTSSYFLKGRLDELALWSVGLTSSEVKEIYNRQKQKFSGVYASPIIDSGGASATWTSLSSTTDIPFNKELTGSSGSETFLTYSIVSAGMMSGLIGLWHLNETAVTAGTSNDFTDASGFSRSGEQTGGVNLGVEGQFGKAIQFDGVDDRIAVEMNLPETAYTNSIWFNTSVASSGLASVCDNLSSCGSNDRHIYLSADGSLCSRVWSDETICTSGTNFADGNWHMLTHVYGSPYSGQRIYVDGKLRASGSKNNSDFNWDQFFVIGFSKDGNNDYFKGLIDEVAIWDRALSEAEILQNYRRGSNRIKYQVRSCDDSACSGDAWLGPDGTSDSYFSEIQNNTSVSASGDPTGAVKVSSLSLDFASSFFNVLARPVNNRYFQYRLILESDDENSLCSGSPCVPEISNLSLGPSPRYYGGNVYIENSSALNFDRLLGISKTDSPSCTSYQVSTDNGTTWNWWNGSAWTTTGVDVNQSNLVSDLTSDRLQVLNAGNFKFRAYLRTNGAQTQQCELNSITVSHDPP